MRNSRHTSSLYLSIPLLLSATSVLANSPHIVYTTEVVTALTTVCPEATELVHGDRTYTITASTTFTITDCPCTRTYPAISPGAPKTILVTTCSSTGSGGPQPTSGAGGNSGSEGGNQAGGSGENDAGESGDQNGNKGGVHGGESGGENGGGGGAAPSESKTPEYFRGAATRGKGLGMRGMVEVLAGVVGVVGWFL